MMELRALGVLLLTASIALTGCHATSTQPPAIERWTGPVADLRMQWTAAPSIDLLSGPAVPVRAYLESRWLAQWAGDLDYAYPGFTEAVPPDVVDSPDIGARLRRPVVESQIRSPLIGNSRFRISSIVGSGRELTAIVCNYTYSVSKPNDDGTYYSVARTESREPRGIFAERISLTTPVDPAHPSLPSQEGPAPSPGANVFGGWQIGGNLNTNSTSLPGFASVWPTYDADTQACVDQAPDPPARIAFLINGSHPRDDFPTSPASPGWPEPTS